MDARRFGRHRCENRPNTQVLKAVDLVGSVNPRGSNKKTAARTFQYHDVAPLLKLVFSIASAAMCTATI